VPFHKKPEKSVENPVSYQQFETFTFASGRDVTRYKNGIFCFSNVDLPVLLIFNKLMVTITTCL
jgi:hypothetical protein